MKNNEVTGQQAEEYRIVNGDILPETESDRVAFWKDRIKRAAHVLGIAKREENAKISYEYIEGKKEVAGKQVYLNYLLPILEERHRESLPAIPLANIEGRSDPADLIADKCRNWLDIILNSSNSGYHEKLTELSWDDSIWGDGVGKLTWSVEWHEPTSSDMSTDEQVLQAQADRAMNENDDPISAHLVESDEDLLHLTIHEQGLMAYTPDTPGFISLTNHIAEHKRKSIIVTSERPVFERVPTNRFVYDPDVPWEKRTWEAELRSVRIRDMISWKYKNVTPENCRPEQTREEQGRRRYEDLTARVWEIHDREENKHYVIAEDGPKEGLFLHEGKWKYVGIEIYNKFCLRKYKPDSEVGISTATQMIPILDELAVVDFNIRKHVQRHANYSLGVPKGSMSSDDKSALRDDNRAIKELTPEALQMAKEFKPPPIPESLLFYRETLLGELRRIAGVDAQDMAVQQPGGTITATESSRRASMSNLRRDDRQERMGRFISWIGYTALQLLHEFGSMAVQVRMMDQSGASYTPLAPEDIPADLDVVFDIKGESDTARERDLIRSREYADWRLSTQEPTDLNELSMWLGHKYGIKRPERFRVKELQDSSTNQVEVPGQQMVPQIGQ